MFFWSFNFATNLSLWTLQFYTTRKVGKMWKIISILWIWKATVIIPIATLHTYRIFKKSSFENCKLTKRICTIQQDFKRHNLRDSGFWIHTKYSIGWIYWNQKLITKNQIIFCWCKWKLDDFFIHFWIWGTRKHFSCISVFFL